MARLIFERLNGRTDLFDIVSDAPIESRYDVVEQFKPEGTIEHDKHCDEWFRYYEEGTVKTFESLSDAVSETNPLLTFTPVEALDA